MPPVFEMRLLSYEGGPKRTMKGGVAKGSTTSATKIVRGVADPPRQIEYS